MPIPFGKFSDTKIAEFKTQGSKTDFSTWNRFDIVSLLSSLKSEKDQGNETVQLLKNHREFEGIVKSMFDAIENIVGTNFFDIYAREYITQFWLRPIDTETFIEFNVS